MYMEKSYTRDEWRPTSPCSTVLTTLFLDVGPCSKFTLHRGGIYQREHLSGVSHKLLIWATFLQTCAIRWAFECGRGYKCRGPVFRQRTCQIKFGHQTLEAVVRAPGIYDWGDWGHDGSTFHKEVLLFKKEREREVDVLRFMGWNWDFKDNFLNFSGYSPHLSCIPKISSSFWKSQDYSYNFLQCLVRGDKKMPLSLSKIQYKMRYFMDFSGWVLWIFICMSF